MKMLAILVFVSLAASGLAQRKCLTPNGEHALCVSIHRCPVLKKAYSNPSREVKRFLDESECGYDNSPWVCCGSVSRFQSLDSITTTPPSRRFTTRRTPAPYTVQLSTEDPRKHRNFGLLPTERQCGLQVLGQNIVGGNETQLDEFPWMALLENGINGKSSGFLCGGMLINNRYVLTAAHCVTGEIIDAAGELFRVRLGEHDTRTTKDCRMSLEGDEEFEECAQPHQDILVEEVIPHQEFNKTGESFHDIALVRLARPAVSQYNIRPICLPVNGESSTPGMQLHVAGWGQTEDKTKYSSNVKLKTRVPIVSQEECRKKYAIAKRRLTNNQFCAGGVEGVDSCTGDSGGPIMGPIPNSRPRRWYAEGVVSYGPVLCGWPGWPGVYTKIYSYMNWILDNMKP